MFRLKMVCRLAPIVVFSLCASACGPSSSDTRGVYLRLPGDRFESNEVQQELTNVDIPGPPATDFLLPAGVVGVNRVSEPDGGFGARVYFVQGASNEQVDAFVDRAVARLGPGSVIRLGNGSEWPDCAGIRPDCERVGE